MNDAERQEAHDVLSERPQKIIRAWMWGGVPWVGCAAFYKGISYLALEKSVPPSIGVLMVSIAVAASAVGICRGYDVAYNTRLANLRLRTQQLEVWERVLDEDEEWDLSELPRRVEVVAGTQQVWNEQYDDEQ